MEGLGRIRSVHNGGSIYSIFQYTKGPLQGLSQFYYVGMTALDELGDLESACVPSIRGRGMYRYM